MRKAVLLLAIVVAVAISAWLALRGPIGPASAPGASHETPTQRGATGEPTAPSPRARAGSRGTRPRAWTHRGDGGVTGTVLEFGTERAVASVEVTLAAGRPGPDRTLAARTGDDGTFSFPAVPNFGAWTLRVRASAPLADAEIAEVAVVEGGATDVGVVYLSPTYGLEGVVVGPSGGPIAGATVRALRPAEAGGGIDFVELVSEVTQEVPAVDSAETDVDGRFRLPTLPPGVWTLHARAAGFRTQVEREVVVPAVLGRAVRIALDPGLVVDGRVRREGAGAVSGITVVAMSEPYLSLGALFDDRTFTTTDGTGAFRFDDLGPGGHVLIASPEGEAMRSVEATLPTMSPVEIVLAEGATLEGLVTGTGGAPVAGAHVIAAGTASEDGVASATTDDAGRYSIRGLPLGTLQIFAVRAEGYVVHMSSANPFFESDEGTKIELVAGRNTHDVQLQSGGTVRGVVREQGTTRGVGGARVSLLSFSSVLTGRPIAVTDSDGRYELRNAPGDRSALVVSKDGWYQPGAPSHLAIFGGADSERDDARDVVVVSAGSVVERDVELARAGVLGVRVLTPEGEPVAGARVRLQAGDPYAAYGNPFGLAGPSAPRWTGADGRARLAGVAPGTPHFVEASAGGWLDGRSDAVVWEQGTDPAEVDVVLHRGGTIEGRVTFGKSPVEGAAVRWISADGEDDESDDVDLAFEFVDPVVHTGPDGGFRIEAVQPGTVALKVSHPSHLPFVARSIPMFDGATVRVDATLTLGAVIVGRVLRADGSPAAHANVAAQRVGEPTDESMEEEDVEWDEPTSAVADASGGFRLEGMEPGRWSLTAASPGSTPSRSVIADAGGAAVVLQLRESLPISGVARLVDGRPAAGVLVQAVPRGEQDEDEDEDEDEDWLEHPWETTSDREGRFELSVPPGTYTLLVGSGEDDASANVRFRAVPDVPAGRVGIVIELEPGLSIRGRVELHDGEPAEWGTVTARPAQEDDEDARSSFASIEDGRFELRGLAPGEYRVRAEMFGNQQETVAQAGQTDVVLRLSRGGTLRGRVVHADGRAAESVDVVAEQLGADIELCMEADDDGAWEFEELAPGTYTLEAHFTDRAGAHHSGKLENVVVTDGGVTEDLVLHLRPRGD